MQLVIYLITSLLIILVVGLMRNRLIWNEDPSNPEVSRKNSNIRLDFPSIIRERERLYEIYLRCIDEDESNDLLCKIVELDDKIAELLGRSNCKVINEEATQLNI